MRKFVAINGSPRPHGSTAALVGEIVKSVGEKDIQVTIHNLNTMDIKGCQSCYACKKDGRCIRQDDMQPLYQELAEADGVIFATPVYMWQMTAQLKLAIDRLYPFLKPDYSSYLSPGKRVLLAVTQGRPDTELFRHYFEHTGRNLQFLGFGEYKVIIAGNTRKAEDLYRQTDVLEEAGRLGVWLAGSTTIEK